MKNNAFDELLASITETDREALTGIAERNPNLREAVMLRSDYSRSQDALRSRVALADQWEKWANEWYVRDAYGEGQGATKRELEKDKQIEKLRADIQDLQTKVSTGGEVTFDELTGYVDKLATERGFATQDAVQKMFTEKASGVEQFVNTNLAGFGHIATKAPKLVIRHFKNFQEELDTDALVDFAVKNGFQDLEKAYDSYTAPKREEAQKAEVEAKIQAAREEERQKVLAERGMSPQSMPTDDTGPEMGPFQRKMLGLDKPKEGEALPIEGEPRLGSGSIAVQAARNWGQ